MFKLLDGSEGNVLAVEISVEYTKDDVEKLKKIFDSRFAEGNDSINLLLKIDNLNLGKIHVNAFVDDSMYALESAPSYRGCRRQ